MRFTIPHRRTLHPLALSNSRFTVAVAVNVNIEEFNRDSLNKALKEFKPGI